MDQLQKYDIDESAREAQWKGFVKAANSALRLLEFIRESIDDDAISCDDFKMLGITDGSLAGIEPPAWQLSKKGREHLLLLQQEVLDHLIAQAQALTRLSPLLAHHAEEARRRCQDIVEAAQSIVGGAEIVAELRRKAGVLHRGLPSGMTRLTFETEVELYAQSETYRCNTCGVSHLLTGQPMRLEEAMRRRKPWCDLIEDYKTASEDKSLDRLARRLVSQNGAEGLLPLMEVALLLRTNAAEQHPPTDGELRQAIEATLNDLGKRRNQEMLGIWYVWCQLEGRTRDLPSTFTTKMLSDDFFGSDAALPLRSDNQFRRRATDPYLSRTDPNEWDFHEWELRGKQGAKTESYFNAIRTAAITFLGKLGRF